MNSRGIGTSPLRAAGRVSLFEGVGRLSTLQLALFGLIVTQLSLFIQPTGFSGGPSDDQRYFDIALQWYRHGPQVGDTHWSLRIPLLFAIDWAFHLFGPTIASLQLVPRVFFAIFVGATTATIARQFGRSAALWWIAFAAVSPVLHQMATSAFPEIVELAFCACSISAFVAARRAGNRAAILWMIVSGLSLGLAIETRETAVVLFVAYVWFAIRDPRPSRFGFIAMGIACMAPIVAHNVWLWAATGDPLYRVHIDTRHVLIPSDHLSGHVYAGGSPFLNPDLASRWIPAGPTNIHWIINPLGDFLIDPAFGFVVLSGLIAVALARRVTLPRIPSRVILLAIAVSNYLIVTWIFTLRPQPRYYLPVVVAAQIYLSLKIVVMAAEPRLRRRVLTLACVTLFGGAVVTLLNPSAGWQARALVPYMASHPGNYFADDHLAGRSATPAAELGIRGPMTGNPRVGEYRVRLLKASTLRDSDEPWRDSSFRAVAMIDRPMPLLLRMIDPNRRNVLLIEQRLR